MKIIRYFAIVGFIALFGEILFDNVVFRLVIALVLGMVLGRSKYDF